MEDEVQRGSTKLAVKVGFWYVLSTFFVKSLAFITTPIFSRLMTKSDYGEFSSYASWQATLLIITGAELYNTLNPAYYDHKDDYDKYVSSVTVLGCIITFIFYGIFFICQDWIFNIVSIPPEYVHVMFITMLCTFCKTVYLSREKTLYRYKSVALISILDLVIPTLISIAFVYFASETDRLSARIYGMYIPSSLVGLILGILLIGKGKSFRLNYCTYALKLSIPLIVHYLTVYLLTSTNTIITKSILGADATALVSIATSVIHILTILFQATTGAVTTWMMDNLDEKKYAQIRKGTIAYLGMLLIISIAVMLFAPEIVWILGGRQYTESTTIIPGLVVSVLVQNMCSIFTIILTYDKNVVKTAVYTGIIAVINIITKIVLLPLIGIQALPAMNIVSYILIFIVSYILVKKAGYKDAVNLKFYIITFSVSVIMMILSFILYKYIFLRYSLILLFVLIIFALCIKERKKIKTFVSKKLKKNKQSD